MISTVAFASTGEIENKEIVKISLNEDVTKSVSTVYCVSVGGNGYCCEAATYSEARSCARSLAKDALQQPEEQQRML